DGDTVTTAQTPGGPFGLGATQVGLTATDPWGNVSKTCQASVRVVDMTGPVIASASAAPAVIWPPNKAMVAVSISASAADNCDAAPSCRITKVTSNEAADFQITGPMTVSLRADRSGSGRGRTYSVWVTCTDASGNDSAPRSAMVVVPHDQGND